MRTFLAAAFLVLPLCAQTSAVVDALEAGDFPRALALLDGGTLPQDEGLRLQAVRLLAKAPEADAAVHDRALRWAAQLLPEQASGAQAEETRVLARDVGERLTRRLVAQKDVLVDGRVTDRAHLGAGLRALHALRLGDAATSRTVVELGLHLTPLLLAAERPRDAIEVATAALAATPRPAEEARLHGDLGRALLQIGRPTEAWPHVRRFLAADPSDASALLPFANALPSSMADELFPLLRAVVGARPRRGTEDAWTACLREFYATADKLAAKKSTAHHVADLTVRMPLPQTWHQVLWGEGYRIWLDPDARPAKIASGKDALILPVPQSHGWRRTDRPPEELTRWNNHAYCLQRGAEGPTFVVYWFGPNLEYWYGDTPVDRGVTGKTVRGHSSGAIARMIFDIAYGEDARRRKETYTSRSALPFSIRESGSHRKTFARGDVIYDETVFAHGQVTIEVLLRVTEAQLAELEPELRWMYATLRKD